MRWSYRSVTTTDGDFVAYVPLRDVRWSRVLNGAGAFTATLTLPLDDQETAAAYRDATEALTRCIYVERDGEVVDGYWLVSRKYDHDSQTVQLEGVQLWALFRRRLIMWEAKFSQVDQLEIARTLVTRTQQQTGGNLAVQVGAESSGRLRDREWLPWDGKNLGEAIEQLAEVIDGFDFRVDVERAGDTYERRFRLFYPRAGRDALSTGHVWRLGANLVSLDWTETGERTANSVVGLGDGEGITKVRAVVTDTSALVEGFPLLEDTILHSTVSQVETLEGHARAHLVDYGRPLARPRARVLADVAPRLSAYVPGDYARLVVPPGAEPFWPDGLDRYARILEIAGEVPGDGGAETVTLTFEES